MKIRIGLVLLGCLAASCTSPDALTSFHDNSHTKDGQFIAVRALSNTSNEIRVYTFFWFREDATKDTSLRLRSYSPPDPQKSGVWIDEKKEPLEKGINVFLTSGKMPTQRLRLTPDEEARLPETLKMSREDLDKFIQTVLVPHATVNK
jgi:hypothetical protein